MASAQVMAKLQADQNAITRMAESHSKQGSNLLQPLSKKSTLANQQWHQSLLSKVKNI